MSQSAPNDIYSIFDSFGSEIGTTLNDLATDWETDPGAKQSNTGLEVISENHEDSSLDFGKRLAKPLFFSNPVYNLLHKENLPQQQVKRPNSIPIHQTNGSNNQNLEIKQKKENKSHKGKKSGQRKLGLMSKISAVTRRHSHKPASEEISFISPPNENRLSTFSYNSGDLSLPSNASSPRHSTSSSSPIKTPIVSELKKPDKVPPQKSPRKSKPNLNVPIRTEDRSNLITKETKNYNEEKQPSAQSNYFVNSKHSSPEKSREVDEKVKEHSTSSTTDITGNSENIRVNHGSLKSLSSTSDDGPPSDEDIKTMEDVISEVADEEVVVVTKSEDTSSNTNSCDNSKVRWKRDRTLRWTGTRKAPALMKEFTRKNSIIASSLTESTEELEAIAQNSNEKLVISSIDSRSGTPSQQFTNFDMTEDYDASDEINDDDNSESENSDRRHSLESIPINNNLNEQDVKKSPSDRESAFIVLSSLLPPAPRLRRTQSSKVRAYLNKLGSNENNALGYSVTHFVEETLKNKEKRPLVLLHDVRSFLSDIKQFLISNPHIGLRKKIEKIVRKSSVDVIDGAVDDALDRLVLYPLHGTIYKCLVVNYKESGQLKVMQEAINLAKRKTAKELGIRKTLVPPNEEALDIIKSHFFQLQRTYSPYFKLKELLCAVTKIYHSTKDLTVEDQSACKLGADDFLPLLVFSLVHCDFIAADIEAQYMDGLLDPILLLGEGGYYLTTLISAIQVVTSIQRKEAALPNISDLQGFLKVGISPSESHPFKKLDAGSEAEEDVVLHKTLHVPPAMTAQSLCQMISKKFNVAAPENYCLHVVVNGSPHALEPNDCPQLVKMDLLTQFPSTSFYFSFQRRENSIKSMDDDSQTETEYSISNSNDSMLTDQNLTTLATDSQATPSAVAEASDNLNIVKTEESKNKPQDLLFEPNVFNKSEIITKDISQSGDSIKINNADSNKTDPLTVKLKVVESNDNFPQLAHDDPDSTSIQNLPDSTDLSLENSKAIDDVYPMSQKNELEVANIDEIPTSTNKQSDESLFSENHELNKSPAIDFKESITVEYPTCNFASETKHPSVDNDELQTSISSHSEDNFICNSVQESKKFKMKTGVSEKKIELDFAQTLSSKKNFNVDHENKKSVDSSLQQENFKEGPNQVLNESKQITVSIENSNELISAEKEIANVDATLSVFSEKKINVNHENMKSVDNSHQEENVTAKLKQVLDESKQAVVEENVTEVIFECTVKPENITNPTNDNESQFMMNVHKQEILKSEDTEKKVDNSEKETGILSLSSEKIFNVDHEIMESVDNRLQQESLTAETNQVVSESKQTYEIEENPDETIFECTPTYEYEPGLTDDNESNFLMKVHKEQSLQSEDTEKKVDYLEKKLSNADTTLYLYSEKILIDYENMKFVDNSLQQENLTAETNQTLNESKQTTEIEENPDEVIFEFTVTCEYEPGQTKDNESQFLSDVYKEESLESEDTEKKVVNSEKAIVNVDAIDTRDLLPDIDKPTESLIPNDSLVNDVSNESNQTLLESETTIYCRNDLVSLAEEEINDLTMEFNVSEHNLMETNSIPKNRAREIVEKEELEDLKNETKSDLTTFKTSLPDDIKVNVIDDISEEDSKANIAHIIFTEHDDSSVVASSNSTDVSTESLPELITHSFDHREKKASLLSDKNSNLTVTNNSQRRSLRRSLGDMSTIGRIPLPITSNYSPIFLQRMRRAGSLASNLDAPYPSRRISCYARDSVATLKEFFESKTVEQTPFLKKDTS